MGATEAERWQRFYSSMLVALLCVCISSVGVNVFVSRQQSNLYDRSIAIEKLSRENRVLIDAFQSKFYKTGPDGKKTLVTPFDVFQRVDELGQTIHDQLEIVRAEMKHDEQNDKQ